MAARQAAIGVYPAFSLPSRTPSWFAGHMAKSLKQLPKLLQGIDIVIEARDARLPLTSINGAFDSALDKAWGRPKRTMQPALAGGSAHIAGSYGDGLRGAEVPDVGVAGSSSWEGAWTDAKGKTREKIVVYTKRDLAEHKYEEPLRKAFLKHTGEKVFFLNSQVDADVRNLLRYAQSVGREHIETSPEGTRVLVVGMPNVGKSSLLNALRRVGLHKGKAFATSSVPGLTRKLTGTVRVSDTPPIYVYDTPGIMLPYLGRGEAGAERGLKLALTRGVKEDLWEEDTVVDYLVWYLEKMRLSADRNYLADLPLPPGWIAPQTITTEGLLRALASRLGALRAGGEPDLEAAQRWFIQAWREGRLGRWTIDDLDASPTAPTAASAESVQDDAIPTPPVAPPASSLDERVSLAVQTYLSTTSPSHVAAVDGADLSPSQQKKRAVAAMKADRRARQEEKYGFEAKRAARAAYLSSAMSSRQGGKRRGSRSRK